MEGQKSLAKLLSDNVAEKLEEKIRTMRVGEKLPSERVMAEEFGISRNMLREKLRVLSDKGMIEILPGKGNYVSNKQEERLVEYLENCLFSDENKDSLLDVVEVRGVMEKGICAKAVENATEEDILELERLCNLMEETRTNIKKYNEYDAQFHLQLATASHNTLYPPLLTSLFNISNRKMFLITELYPIRVDSSQREHWEMIEAIKKRDKKSIKQIASKHYSINDILRVQKLVKEKMVQEET